MNTPSFTTRIVSSLEKVLFTDRPEQHPALDSLSALRGETIDFQLLVLDETPGVLSSRCLTVGIEGLPFPAVCREAASVPADLPAYRHDTSVGTPYFIESKSGCYPDPLLPIDNGMIHPAFGRTFSLWITLTPDLAGDYPVTVTLRDGDTLLSSDTLHLTVLPVSLPEQELICTQWFHCDCLADYYRLPIFSPAHWQVISDYMRCAVENGVNCLLTPIFTPPLDTEVGGERPTVQLIGVTVREDGYAFDFSLLKEWLALAQRNGVRYFEISHLFSQWGAEFAPKIVAERDGRLCRIFGWDTPGTEGEYPRFLSCLLPELTAFLREAGVLDRCFFHISDEPNEQQLEGYRKAKAIVAPYLEGCAVIDALSAVEFYRKGIISTPIPDLNKLESFLDEPIGQRWTYYCCAQWDRVSNRFLAYPSSRNRILGVQLYKYGISGFLQWGFNFWYSKGSRRLINPFLSQSGERWVPSGDAFVVYPGEDGKPLESLRLRVFHEAIQDIAALSLCEKLVGRERVTALIDEIAGGEVTLRSYPAESSYLLKLREEVNRLIASAL